VGLVGRDLQHELRGAVHLACGEEHPPAGANLRGDCAPVLGGLVAREVFHEADRGAARDAVEEHLGELPSAGQRFLCGKGADHAISVGHGTASPTEAQQREASSRRSYPSTITVALP